MIVFAGSSSNSIKTRNGESPRAEIIILDTFSFLDELCIVDEKVATFAALSLDVEVFAAVVPDDLVDRSVTNLFSEILYIPLTGHASLRRILHNL